MKTKKILIPLSSLLSISTVFIAVSSWLDNSKLNKIEINNMANNSDLTANEVNKNTRENAEPFKRPDNIFPGSKPVTSSKYDVSIGSQEYIFDYNLDGSKSYRIPGLIKLNNGDILISADKRWNGSSDYGQGKIDQVFRRSTDNGLTYHKAEQIVRVKAPKTNDGLTIDGVFNEVLVDKNDPHKGFKLLYFFNIFPGYQGLPALKQGVPFKKVGSESVWKLWIKDTNGNLSPVHYVLRKVSSKSGWWRVWQLPEGKMRDTLVEADLSTLIPLKTYVDTSYDPESRSVSGQVYENVDEEDLADPIKLSSKATSNSIFDDTTKVDSKYIVAINNSNALLESYDNGKTWANLQITDHDWRNDEYDNSPFIGNGVGSGIQLKNQKDKNLNGRIIFPLYGWHTGTHEALYIYSNDNGKTWQRKDFVSFPSQLSESTIHEANDGTLWWFFRNPRSGGHSVISKSVDGGVTWIDPLGGTGSSHEITNSTWNADVYTGFAHFNIKGEDYFLLTAPNNRSGRKNGAMFITKDWKTFDKVWEFDPDPKHQFAYSYPLTVEVGDNYADIVVAFEWNPKTTFVEITANKFRVIIK